ncbi:MAG: S-layer homology domain-containing protein, partial [Anaerolineales bacterium]|nr:S-layer homology domain-containing protein [Anaerolineales bacterium]
GRYVAFESYAYNLVSGDTNGKTDIFVRDTIANTTTRISVDSSGADGNGHSRTPSISADGHYVAFNSGAANLAGGNPGIFVRDMVTNTTMRIPVDSGSNFPAISADGHFVTFVSLLINGDPSSWGGIFLHEIPPPPVFGDVPTSYWAWQYIERLFNAGITGGCSVTPLNYCPDSTVTRAQMAVFLLKGTHGSNYTPPSVGASTGFDDVTADYWAAAWIKQLAAEGITSGCGAGNYCPDATVTRAQMAVFLLKTKHGSAYTPPSASGVFIDVPVGYWADKWIEQLAVEGITGGCGSGNYCPDDSVTRAQMAVFLVKAFNLP